MVSARIHISTIARWAEETLDIDVRERRAGILYMEENPEYKDYEVEFRSVSEMPEVQIGFDTDNNWLLISIPRRKVLG